MDASARAPTRRAPRAIGSSRNTTAHSRTSHARLGIDPQNALTYSNRAEVYRMLGKYDAVIADTTQAIKLGSKLNSTYALRGVAYVRTGEIDKAREDFKQALALPPQGGDASWAQDVARQELQRLEGK